MLEGYKLIGAGLTTIGIGSAAIGGGIVFGSLIIGTSRNPSMQGKLFTLSILGFSLVEALGLFCLALAFMILFAFKLIIIRIWLELN